MMGRRMLLPRRHRGTRRFVGAVLGAVAGAEFIQAYRWAIENLIFICRLRVAFIETYRSDEYA